jgi:hypothetical protein
VKKYAYALIGATALAVTFVTGYVYGELKQRRAVIVCSMDDEKNQVIVRDGSYELTNATCDKGEQVTLLWHD